MNQRPTTFKRRLTSFMLVVIAVFSAIYVIMFIAFSYYNDQYSENVNNYFTYNRLANEINRASVEFDNYLQNPSETVYENYTDSIEKARLSAAELKTASENERLYYSIVGLEEMILSYAEKNADIIDQMDTSTFQDTYRARSDSLTIYSYINIRISDAMEQQTVISKEIFDRLNDNSRELFVLTLLILASAVIFLLLFILNFSRGISTPVTQLSEYAKQIAVGGFDAPDIKVENSLELNDLAASLNTMKAKLGELFEEQQSKVQLEARLHERELENLRISNELKNTELKVLQAQINPHFLFNTLNSINRLAFLNDNHEIVAIIEALSEMLRYSLNKISGPITLQDEIDNLKRYIYIQQVRFKKKLNIELDIHTEHLDMELPCLILQPLVENSIIHGLRSYNYDGDVYVKIFDEQEAAIVTIADTGIGIAPATLLSLQSFSATGTFTPNDTKSTSIGLSNVEMRLKQYFGVDGTVRIESIENEGTTITLTLPFTKNAKIAGGF